MKVLVSTIICFLMLAAVPCSARDFIVQFVEENYKETQSPFSYAPIIYHSIQVTTETGPKLIIITGDSYHRRTWLRRAIAQDKALVLKVPDADADRFIVSSAFEVDLENIHPLNMALYEQGMDLARTDPERFGEPQVLMTDPDAMRKRAMAAQKAAKMAQEKKAQVQDRKDLQKKQEKPINQQDKAAADKQKREKEQAKVLADLREKQQQELEKERENRDRQLALLVQQQIEQEKSRRQELEQRWQELKQRLLQDERIKSLERSQRERELQYRWLELKQRYNIL